VAHLRVSRRRAAMVAHLRVSRRWAAMVAQCEEQDARGDEGDRGDDERAAHPQRGKGGGHEQGTHGIPDTAAQGEDAHIGVDPPSRNEARPPRALRMVGGDPRARHDHGRQRHGKAVDDPDGTDAQPGEDEPGGHQPEAGAAVAVRAEEGLQHGAGHARGEREDADCGVAVVTFDDEKRQQGPQGRRAQVGAAMPQREREHWGTSGGPRRCACAHLSAWSCIASPDSSTRRAATPTRRSDGIRRARGSRAASAPHQAEGALRGDCILSQPSGVIMRDTSSSRPERCDRRREVGGSVSRRESAVGTVVAYVCSPLTTLAVVTKTDIDRRAPRSAAVRSCSSTSRRSRASEPVGGRTHTGRRQHHAWT
jgi:hypothetical protein